MRVFIVDRIYLRIDIRELMSNAGFLSRRRCDEGSWEVF
jgi:hypothetical protein